jgi:uncharacterized protein (TIGR02145 family)
MKKQNRIWIYALIIMGLVSILPNGCKKDNNINPATAITDADGNVYTSVTIGTQVWMVENLRTTKSNNGTPIPLVTDEAAWGALDTPGYCWYNNDEVANKTDYGALYNWPAAVNACPAGWHLPTDEEYKILERNLGMNNTDANATGWRYSGLVGGSLKEAGTMHWMMPAMGATNTSGFTALPGGDRDTDLGFLNLGDYSYFWSASPDGTPRAWYRRLNNDNAGVHRSSSRQSVGYSVRCLKN